MNFASIQETGEVIELSHRYEYTQEDVEIPLIEKSNSTVEDIMKFQTQQEDLSTSDIDGEFSMNGVE